MFVCKYRISKSYQLLSKISQGLLSLIKYITCRISIDRSIQQKFSHLHVTIIDRIFNRKLLIATIDNRHVIVNLGVIGIWDIDSEAGHLGNAVFSEADDLNATASEHLIRERSGRLIPFEVSASRAALEAAHGNLHNARVLGDVNSSLLEDQLVDSVIGFFGALDSVKSILVFSVERAAIDGDGASDFLANTLKVSFASKYLVTFFGLSKNFLVVFIN